MPHSCDDTYMGYAFAPDQGWYRLFRWTGLFTDIDGEERVEIYSHQGRKTMARTYFEKNYTLHTGE